jgi:2-iminobutanoate/2-iminopropanoate deaminase
MRNLCLIVLLAALPIAAEKKVIAPPEFANGAPFSPGILVDGTLYVAGQVGQGLKTRQIPADFETEVKTALANIGLVLKAADMDYKDVVSVQVYLTEMDLFQRMNAVYTEGRGHEAGRCQSANRNYSDGETVGQASA